MELANAMKQSLVGAPVGPFFADHARIASGTAFKIVHLDRSKEPESESGSGATLSAETDPHRGESKDTRACLLFVSELWARIRNIR